MVHECAVAIRRCKRESANSDTAQSVYATFDSTAFAVRPSGLENYFNAAELFRSDIDGGFGTEEEDAVSLLERLQQEQQVLQEQNEKAERQERQMQAA
jgi:hypothetical protein